MRPNASFSDEPGFVLMLPPFAGKMAWDYLCTKEMPSGHKVAPAGLAARESLRIEAGLPGAVAELASGLDPVSLGLESLVDMDAHAFIGKDAIEKQKSLRDYVRDEIGDEASARRARAASASAARRGRSTPTPASTPTRTTTPVTGSAGGAATTARRRRMTEVPSTSSRDGCGERGDESRVHAGGRRDQLLEVVVTRAEYAHIHRDLRASADALDDAFLQETQQLCL